MSFSEVVILSAVRTPVGDFSGGLSKVPAHQLGAAVIGAALERAKVPKEDVSEVIMGQVRREGVRRGRAPPSSRRDFES